MRCGEEGVPEGNLVRIANYPFNSGLTNDAIQADLIIPIDLGTFLKIREELERIIGSPDIKKSAA